MRRLYRVDRDIQPPALLGREDVRDFSLNLSVEMVAESEEEVVETVLAHAKVTAADLTDIEAEPLTELHADEARAGGVPARVAFGDVERPRQTGDHVHHRHGRPERRGRHG